MGTLATVVLTALLGFLAGLLSFKVKSGWCRSCGAVKRCPTCIRVPAGATRTD